ncbi:hypothetical protein Sjap_004530 [Stephania japonica]|uniref:Uncharacterized protein n=1 Tax=Stephania japonica TaxID=461633 RepID=A0AAP0K2G4_9MAGN
MSSAENNSLNIEAGPLHDQCPPPYHKNSTSTTKWPLLLCCLFVAIGIVGGPLLVRFYYLNGGSRQWLIKPNLILPSACMGMLYGLINFLYSQGLSYLPASISSLLQSA